MKKIADKPKSLGNIDPSLLDKSKGEKQLDTSEISSFIEGNRNSNTSKKTYSDPNVWTRWCNSINERRLSWPSILIGKSHQCWGILVYNIASLA